MRSVRFFIILVLAGPGFQPAFADGGYSRSESPLAPFHELIEAEKYQAAIDRLQEALEEDPDNADLLNLTAFSQRKLQRYDAAMANYRKALEIDPEHRGANEYIGELYLQLGQVDKAEERLKILDEACFFGCDEYDQLEQAIENWRAENQ